MYQNLKLRLGLTYKTLIRVYQNFAKYKLRKYFNYKKGCYLRIYPKINRTNTLKAKKFESCVSQNHMFVGVDA